jgi:hypothetical protein
MRKHILTAAGVFCCAASASLLTAADTILVRTENDVFRAFDEGGELFSCSPISFKPNWGWMGMAGAIGMQDWLAIPAKPLQQKDDRILADGEPFKIWGTNVEYSDCAPAKEVADQRAAFFAKFGINAVRLHKLTNPGWEGLGSKDSASTYDPASLDRFDYANAQLRRNGVLYGFSPIWDLMVFEGDRAALKGYDEIVAAGRNKPTTRGLVWFAPDVQDLHIATLVNLLDHRNPYTQLRYAEDPALAYVEIQNEEDVFFYTTTPLVAKCPTYQAMFAEQFSDWLKQKYGSHEALAQAWGDAAINTFRNEGGLPDETTIPLADGVFHLDTGRDRTLYCLVEFE